MNTNLIIVLTVFGGCGATVAAWIVSRWAAAKHLNLTGLAQKAIDGYGVAETFATALKPFVPSPYSGWITIIFALADKAIKTAEQAWQAGTCPEELRKEKAVELIENGLALEGITVDDRVKKLIDVAVETLVQTLPKSHTEAIETGAAK